MTWMQTVHDNIIMGALDFARVLYVANNVVIPDVIKYNQAQETYKAAMNTIGGQEVTALLNAKKDQNGKVGVGINGEFPLFLMELDKQYALLAGMVSKMRPEKKQLWDLLNHKDSGYIPPVLLPNGRPDQDDTSRADHRITLPQFKRLYNGYIEATGMFALLNKWAHGNADTREQVRKEIEKRGRAGIIAGFI